MQSTEVGKIADLFADLCGAEDVSRNGVNVGDDDGNAACSDKDEVDVVANAQ